MGAGGRVRLIVLAVLLALASSAVVVGVAMLSVPAAWIVGGIATAVLAFVFLADVPESAA